MKNKLQRGQALILIALAFLGLVGFIGLTVDAGILFTNIGFLRRAIDAATIAAASQYLADTTSVELMATVKEFLELNGIDPDQPALEIHVCNLAGPPDFAAYHDASMCKEANPWDYDRKLVQVKAELPVDFAFLPVIGFRSIDIKAEAIAEAASVDLMLVIDTSQSMADDGPPLPGCKGAGTCEPMETVRASAKRFVQSLAFPYDRVGIVHFDAYGYLVNPPGLTDVEADALAAIDTLQVYEQSPCPGALLTPPDPTGCLSTNVAGGLREAAAEFSANGRQEALWVVVTLSDGAANQARDAVGDWICPEYPAAPDPRTWVQPYCADGDGGSRHASSNNSYDVDDISMDFADMLGCYQLANPDQSAYCAGAGIDGWEALVFTIGVGDKIINGNCDPWYAANGETCHPDKGERLLRYIAAAGDDGNPLSDLCAGVPNRDWCGNYYFVNNASELDPVFDDIGKRVYTKITQ